MRWMDYHTVTGGKGAEPSTIFTQFHPRGSLGGSLRRSTTKRLAEGIQRAANGNPIVNCRPIPFSFKLEMTPLVYYGP